MNAEIFPPIPLDTAKAARAVYGRSNFYLTVGDQVDSLFSGLPMDDPFLRLQKPSETLARLYLVTIFQFIETLPDHQAIDALQERLDWKYALHLPLSYPDLKESLLCEFRRRLLLDQANQQNLKTITQRLSEVVLVTGKADISTGSDQIVASVCLISRLGKVWLAINRALGALAIKQPEWLRLISLPHWYERYGHRQRNLNFGSEKSEQGRLAEAIGMDGFYLLRAIDEVNLSDLVELPEVSALRRLWRGQYELVDGKVAWRKEACAECPLIGQNYKKTGSRSRFEQEVNMK